MDDMQPNDGSMGQDQSQGQQGGYCIEIYIGANGQPTSVNVETMDDESAEEQGSSMQGMDQGDMDGQGAGESDKGVPVGSLEEAMSMVKQIVQNQGSMPAAGGNDRESIARKVFGDELVDKQTPGELNRKGRSGY